ncbi:hypothetical protein DL766_003697 [Monosporascus sp. MC13-8B]|uniref:Micro-fibrillar-associated protein 1 C-terminal domain-containing protein n=1 Tax=Monosporascus cannonballus TaxID=155416 RepID=A0ABY0GZN9_9PEZI|nr:hypothetical protein DL762_007603 [Monosporascus cannonballus]RYO82136.1 hypothetical protein DL763_008332 [Monosporascus cannonballus]RYP32973.1 hypothetical protein DL766_003697 [Monosporascus sp. MC13-8B]
MPRASKKTVSTSQPTSATGAAPCKRRAPATKSTRAKRPAPSDEAAQTEHHAASTATAPPAEQPPPLKRQKLVDGEPEEKPDITAPFRLPDIFGKRHIGRRGKGEDLTPMKRMPIKYHRDKGGYSDIWGMGRVLPSLLKLPRQKPGNDLEPRKHLHTLEPRIKTTEDSELLRSFYRRGHDGLGGREKWRAEEDRQWREVDVRADIGKPWGG